MAALTRTPHATVQAFRGDTLRLRFTVKDTAAAAVDLSGVTAARWAIYRRHGTAALINKSLGSGISVTDAAAGQVFVSVVSAETALLSPGLHEDELELTISGDIQTAAWGLIEIREDRQK